MTRRIVIDTIPDLLIASRWAHFAAISILFGSCLWWLIEPKGGQTRSATILVRLASAAAISSGLGWIVCSLAGMTGDLTSVFDPDTIWLLFFATPFGPVLIVRLASLSILLVLAFAPISNHIRLVSIAIVSGLLMVSQAWLGHAAQGGPDLRGTIMIVVYAIHVLAAGAWAGSLPALLVSVVARRDRREIFDVLRCYSAVATVAVPTIVVSGIANTLFRVNDSIMALASSPYGTVLFVKVGLVACMLVCAAWIRFAAMPSLRDRAVNSPRPLALRVGLSLELALGVLVLGVAALLGVTPPPS